MNGFEVSNVLTNGFYSHTSFSRVLWSPTEEDFDRLIEEQECFEISLRQEKARNQTLVKEMKRLKKEHRKEVIRLEKEIATLKYKATYQEEAIESLEKQVETQKDELNELKVLSANPPPSHKPGRVCIPRKFPDVVMDEKVPPPLLSLSPGVGSDFIKEPLTEPLSLPQSHLLEPKFKKTASLVAQLVQGFEAVAAANGTPTNASVSNEHPRRRQTVHGYRTVTFSRH